MTEIDIEKELHLMVKFKLSYEEINIVKLLFIAQQDHNDYIIQYFSECSPENQLRDVLISLQNKGVILKSCKIPNKGSKLDVNTIIFNKMFQKSYLKHCNDLGEELLAAYPPYITIDGAYYSLKNITKVYKSMEDFCFAYGKAIKFDMEKHKEVLEILEDAKANDLINFGICEFVVSRKWADVSDLGGGKIEMNGYNNMRLI